jgi:hypothetical protein
MNEYSHMLVNEWKYLNDSKLNCSTDSNQTGTRNIISMISEFTDMIHNLYTLDDCQFVDLDLVFSFCISRGSANSD